MGFHHTSHMKFTGADQDAAMDRFNMRYPKFDEYRAVLVERWGRQAFLDWGHSFTSMAAEYEEMKRLVDQAD